MYSPMDISWSVVVVVVPSLTAGELLVELDSADVAGLVGKITTRKLNFNTIRSYSFTGESFTKHLVTV